MKKQILSLAILCGVFSQSALAESSASSLNLSTEVVPSCEMIFSKDNITFPLEVVSPQGLFNKVYAIFYTITCSKGVVYNLKSSSEQKVGEGPYMYLLGPNGSKIQYLPVVAGFTGTATGLAEQKQFRISVPYGQYVEPGTYTDNITIILTY